MILNYTIRSTSFALALFLGNVSFADDAPYTALDIPANQYAGRKQEVSANGLPPSSSIKWRVATSGRALASGNASSAADGSVKIDFELPPLHDGAALTGEMVISPKDAQDFKAPLVLHSSNIFAEGEIAKMPPSIGVWAADNDTEANLVRILKSQGLDPDSVSSISSYKGDLLIVCGMDFDDNTKAFDSMLAFAGKGSEVIVLPPTKGSFRLKPELLSSLHLEKGFPEAHNTDKGLPDTRLITEKKLSHDLGILSARSDCAGFSLIASDSALEFKFAKSPVPSDAFHFSRLDVGKGRVLFFGWNLMALSDVSPVPLLALKSLVEEMNFDDKAKSKEKSEDNR